MSWNFDTVYLARHGETTWNTEGRFQGQYDSPLTDQGLAQAQAGAAVLATHSIDSLFTSPLGRARTSAAFYAVALGKQMTTIDALMEIDTGSFTGRTRAELQAAESEQFSERELHLYDWRFPGGESFADIDKRAEAALRRIESTGAKRPLIVSHGMLGRMLLRSLTSYDAQTALRLKQPNNLIYVITPATGQMERLEATQPPT